jgi:ASC-1-like (ASCH) protein
VRNHSLRVRDEYLAWVLDGRKTVEVRVAYPHLARMSQGDTVTFNGRHMYRVVRVNLYLDFDALLQGESPASIAPEIAEREVLLRVLREIYPPEKEALGVLAIHLAPEPGEGRPAPEAR